MIRTERLTAVVAGPFVVFLIGMRINRPWRVDKWLPVMRAMGRMLDEFSRKPEAGLLGAKMWFGRTAILVQCWRSTEQLLAYAKDKEAGHLPVWRAFHRSVGTNGAVGIWHEAYAVAESAYENAYVNMPEFGLGKVGTLEPARGALASANGRLAARWALEPGVADTTSSAATRSTSCAAKPAPT